MSTSPKAPDWFIDKVNKNRDETGYCHYEDLVEIFDKEMDCDFLHGRPVLINSDKNYIDIWEDMQGDGYSVHVYADYRAFTDGDREKYKEFTADKLDELYHYVTTLYA